MESKNRIGMTAEAGACASAQEAAQIKVQNHYRIEAFSPSGDLKWVEEFSNIVPTGGLNDVLDKYLKGSAYTAAFFIGLTDGTPTVAAGDTMASHAGWAEVTAYSEGTRPALTLGAVSGGSVDNSASKATFTISANGTAIGGAFMATDSTKGGTTGVLYSVAAFAAGDKSLDSGDTLSVTVTCTSASA